MVVTAVFGPGAVVREAAADLLARLEERLGLTGGA
jgi:methylmalonyl-CoA mutase cobalamin-binding subunit